MELALDVAAGACVFPVLADEREVGRVVIELHLRPSDGRMTPGALRTERLVVRVIVFMAVKAL